MLTRLSIRNIVLIEALDLNFGRGLGVLTGETGAGKSILLDALGLALGAAGRADMLRAGAEEGAVAAVFDFPPDHPGREILAEAGLSAEDDEIILRRRLAGGRLTGFVNGQRAPAEVLRALGETLVEIHGQHDDRGLLNPRGHRAILDAFASALPLVEETRAAWDALRRGDQVVTAGGLMGKVTRVKDGEDEVEVELAEGVKVRVVRGTIAQVVSKTEPVKDA